MALYSAQTQVWHSGVVIYYDNREESAAFPQAASTSLQVNHLLDTATHGKQGGGENSNSTPVGREAVTERKRAREETLKRSREGSSSSSSAERDNARASLSGEGHTKTSVVTSKRVNHNNSTKLCFSEENQGGGAEKDEGGEAMETEKPGHLSSPSPASVEEKDQPQHRKKEDEKVKKRARKGSAQEELPSVRRCWPVSSRYLIAFDDDRESAWVDFDGILDVTLFDNTSHACRGEGDKLGTSQK